MQIVMNGGGGVINEPRDEEVQEFWYTYDVCGRLATWFSDGTYEPHYTPIRSALRRQPGESLAGFKARCAAWERENK